MKKHAVILLFFILSSVIYFHDAFFVDALLAAGDGIAYSYHAAAVIAGQYSNGKLPLWNSHIFCGFPIMAASQHGVLYPLNIILLLFFPLALSYNLNIIFHISLAGYFTVLYARKIGMEMLPSVFAGIVFAFLGYLATHLQHVSVLQTCVWFPLIFYCFEKIRLKADSTNAIYASFPLAMQILAGQTQIYFYTYIVLLLFVVFHAMKMSFPGRIRFAAASTSAILMASIVCLPQLYSTYELFSLGLRTNVSYDVFASFSQGFEKMPYFLFPLFYGQEGYMLSVILAAVVVVKEGKTNRHAAFWGIVALLSYVLALGGNIEPLHRILYHIPIYNSFRAVSKHMFEFSFAVSILSALGISIIVKGVRAGKILPWLSVLSISIAAASLIYSHLSAKEFSKAALYHLSFLSFISICILLITRLKQYKLFLPLIALTVFIDVISIRVDDWPKAKDMEDYYPGIFNPVINDGNRIAVFSKDISFMLVVRRGANLISGVDPLVIADYRTLLGTDMAGVIRPSEWAPLIKNNLILSLLNVKYLFLDRRFLPPGFDFSSIETLNRIPTEGRDSSLYRKVFDTPDYVVYENLNCIPRAFAVSRLLALNDIREIKQGFYSSLINPRVCAVVSKNDLAEIGMNKFSRGEVKITYYDYDRIVMRTDFGGRGFVVLADQYYPGWEASIDGLRVNIYRTNGVLRGVIVPEGTHEIIFRYRPVKIYISMAIGAISLLSILTLIVLTQQRI